MNKKPTCFDCQNGKVIKGFPGTYHEPPVPDEVDCQSDDIDMDSEAFERYSTEDASDCPCLKLIMITENCYTCQCKIDSPIHSHPYWIQVPVWGDSIPVCSDNCAVEGQTKIREEVDSDMQYDLEDE